MQTRYMERTNSMKGRGKRSLEGGGDEEQESERKRPALASVIVEALKVDSLQKLCSSLEPILRRVVTLNSLSMLLSNVPVSVTAGLDMVFLERLNPDSHWIMPPDYLLGLFWCSGDEDHMNFVHVNLEKLSDLYSNSPPTFHAHDKLVF